VAGPPPPGSRWASSRPGSVRAADSRACGWGTRPAQQASRTARRRCSPSASRRRAADRNHEAARTPPSEADAKKYDSSPASSSQGVHPLGYLLSKNRVCRCILRPSSRRIRRAKGAAGCISRESCCWGSSAIATRSKPRLRCWTKPSRRARIALRLRRRSTAGPTPRRCRRAEGGYESFINPVQGDRPARRARWCRRCDGYSRALAPTAPTSNGRSCLPISESPDAHVVAPLERATGAGQGVHKEPRFTPQTFESRRHHAEKGALMIARMGQAGPCGAGQCTSATATPPLSMTVSSHRPYGDNSAKECWTPQGSRSRSTSQGQASAQAHLRRDARHPGPNRLE